MSFRTLSCSPDPATNSETTNLNGIMTNMAILIVEFQIWELFAFFEISYK